MKVNQYDTGRNDVPLKEEGIYIASKISSTNKQMPYSGGNFYLGVHSTDIMSSFTEMHPFLWSKDDVYTWLEWCRREYALSDVPLEKFSMNGKALCVLTKEDFKERAPNVGDVLYNTLHRIATANLHPSFRNGLPIVPQLASPSGLLIPTPAAAMCNTVIPAAQFQQMFAQTFPAPMTPDSSPSAPSLASNSTPPRNVTPVTQETNPAIVITPSSNRVSPASNTTECDANCPEFSIPSPQDKKKRTSPNQTWGIDNPDKCTEASSDFIDNTDRTLEAGPKGGCDQPLNLSRRPSRIERTPSPPTLTPHVKAELPYVPGARLQAACKASAAGVFAKHHFTLPGSPSMRNVSSPSIPLVIQKINQSGGEMIVNEPNPGNFNINHYNINTNGVQGLREDIKKEPEAESQDHSQRSNCSQKEKQLNTTTSNAPNVNIPLTPCYDPISPGEYDEDISEVETPFTPPVTPGGSLIGLSPGSLTPNGTLSSGRSDGTGKLLWEFLSELLNEPTIYNDPKPIVRWIDKSTYTFQILDTGRLSNLWGQQKNRGTMNYEKLSRALRYYKKVGIIEKAPGKRLTYKFMKPPSSIKRGQRGARPGVPRKNRRQSLLQSQQSINGEVQDNKTPSDINLQTPTATEISAAYTIAQMPQLITAGTLTEPLEAMLRERKQALQMARVPLSAGSLFTGFPIVMPASTPLSANELDRKHTETPKADNASISTKTTQLPVNNEASTAKATFPLTPSTTRNISDSEVAKDNNDRLEVESKEQSDNTREIIQVPSVQDNIFNSNKAVHLGMPVAVPTYMQGTKAKPRSPLNSLSKRRQMSASSDGSAPKKIPRLILPKSLNNSGYSTAVETVDNKNDVNSYAEERNSQLDV